jgi:aspartyl-tRNA(Asn)/glutamyl-tRNA(Gln) amidotransferase subunit A
MLSNHISIGTIGAGNMATALIEGLLATGVAPSQLWASDPAADKLQPLAAKGVQVDTDNARLINACDVVIVAVKPQVMATVVQALSPALAVKPVLLISVAAGITPFALGTDGGGSIRIPASFCGLAGIKAQFGRVPVWPTSATPTLAHVGPLARSIQDATMLLSVISGYDERDPASVSARCPDFLSALNTDISSLRIAVSSTLGYARPDPNVVMVLNNAASVFEKLGCEVVHIDAVFETDPADLWTAEFYAGVGTRLRPFLEKDWALLDPAVAQILEAALAQGMREYYEKVFARYALRERVRTFFESYDILLTPVSPVSSINTGKNIPDHLLDRNLVSWVFYTYPFNLTGQPALTIPGGIDAEGMPVGIQLVGRTLREVDIIAAASAFEKENSIRDQLFPFK